MLRFCVSATFTLPISDRESSLSWSWLLLNFRQISNNSLVACLFGVWILNEGGLVLFRFSEAGHLSPLGDVLLLASCSYTQHHCIGMTLGLPLLAFCCLRRCWSLKVFQSQVLFVDVSRYGHDISTSAECTYEVSSTLPQPSLLRVKRSVS